MSLRALIVDDEPLACERLRELLASESSVRVIGTCANGREALAAIQRDSPDVVFLDVRMPDMDGLAFLKALPPAPKPLIIFVTGHAKHALKAFEVHAVDFLLKPFDRERLRAALHRALERSEASEPLGAPENIDALRLRLAPSPEEPDRIVVEKNGRIVFLKVAEIDWIAAADNYAELHAGPSSYLMRATLTALEARLPRVQFLRISRSTIVNVSRMREVYFKRHGNCIILLEDGTKLGLARNYRRSLDRFLVGR